MMLYFNLYPYHLTTKLLVLCKILMPHICVCLCQIYLTVLYSMLLWLSYCFAYLSFQCLHARTLSKSLFLRHLLCMLVMSVKSSLELLLYCFIYIPTLNKSYLIKTRNRKSNDHQIILSNKIVTFLQSMVNFYIIK
jgi:hypothetical protein